MNNTKTLQAVVFASLLVFTISCINVNKFATEDWNASWAVPLIHSKVVMEDFLDSLQFEGGVDIDQNNFITLFHSSQVSAGRVREKYEIPPSFGFPLLDTAIVVDPSDFELDVYPQYTLLKNGKLQISFPSYETYDLEVELEIQNLVMDGQAFRYSFTVPFDGNPPSMFNTTIDISGYALDFSEPINIRYWAYDNNSERIWITGMFPNLNFISLDYSYIEGNFNTLFVDLGRDSILINFFDDSFSGAFELTDPKILLRFRTSVGVPFQIREQELYAKTQKQGKLDIDSPLSNPEGYIFDFPQTPGDNVMDTLQIDVSNSNIDEVINALPTKIVYDTRAVAFPPGYEDFVGFTYDSSSFEMHVDLELPLEGSVQNLVYETTTEVTENDIEEAKEIEFRLITNNDFPLEIEVQVFFEDENGQILGKLFGDGEGVIPPATRVNLAGRAVLPGEGELTALLEPDELENIRNMHQIRLAATLSTRNDNALAETRIFSDYELELKLGMRAIFE